jgi:hypothetical protein
MTAPALFPEVHQESAVVPLHHTLMEQLLAGNQVCERLATNKNGAVASAVPSALTRGPAHFDWH